MAMSIGSSSASEPSSMASINVTPLVDVMLVLLIIFLITIPVINKNHQVSLPKAVNIPTQTKPENITISVDKNGDVYWNDKRVPSREELLAHVEAAAVKKPQPEIHIRADKDAKYESVGKVIFTIQRGGVVKVGFLTEPDHGLGAVR